MSDDYENAEQIDRAAQEGREEGRNEILREIAKLEEFPDGHRCVTCLGTAFDRPHEETCLWVRAQRVPA